MRIRTTLIMDNGSTHRGKVYEVDSLEAASVQLRQLLDDVGDFVTFDREDGDVIVYPKMRIQRIVVAEESNT